MNQAVPETESEERIHFGMSANQTVVMATLLGRQCTPDEKLRAVYMYLMLNYSYAAVAQVFTSSKRSVKRWVKKFIEKGTLEREVCSATLSSFTSDHRAWIVSYLYKKPLTYLRELAQLFRAEFKKHISETTVFRIVHDAGFTNKKVKRIAMQIRTKEVARYCKEMEECLRDGCLQSSYLFLDVQTIWTIILYE